MRKLLQINPVARISTSTGRIMKEIGDLAIDNGWDSYIAYSKGRDGIKTCRSKMIPIGNKLSVAWHGFITRIFDRHGLTSNCATRRFIKEIEKIKPDIIHIHNVHGYFLNYKILFDFLAKSDIPIIWTVHDCWLFTGHCYYYSYINCNKWEKECDNCPQKRLFPSSLLYDRSKKNFYDKSKSFNSIKEDKFLLVPVSNWMKGELDKSFLKNNRSIVIHNGIDLSIFKHYPDNDIKERYNIKSKYILLGVASIWCKEKGLDDFMELSKHLNKDEIIVLIGVDDSIKKNLPKNILGIRRTENISELAKFYSVATVFINPTWQDNFPTVNLEAISCGTPVITYNTGGSIEAIADGTGYIVEKGDINKVIELTHNIEDLGKENFVQSCTEYAQAHFNKEDKYLKYIELYNKIKKV